MNLPLPAIPAPKVLPGAIACCLHLGLTLSKPCQAISHLPSPYDPSLLSQLSISKHHPWQMGLTNPADPLGGIQLDALEVAIGLHR